MVVPEPDSPVLFQHDYGAVLTQHNSGPPGLTEAQRAILRVLAAHPEGLTADEIRAAVHREGIQGRQEHLLRRLRELRRWYHIPNPKPPGYKYVLKGTLATPEAAPAAAVDRKLRAEILHRDHYRCQMCGKTPAEDGVKLEVDHRVPQSWFADQAKAHEPENLWAVCHPCNHGKNAFFASITDPRVQTAMAHKSIHVRLGELLIAFQGEAVPKAHLALVAFTHDDWEKRLRELREIGWDYRADKMKANGRTMVSFRLLKAAPWPEGDVSAAIRAAEKRKKVVSR